MWMVTARTGDPSGEKKGTSYHLGHTGHFNVQCGVGVQRITEGFVCGPCRSCMANAQHKSNARRSPGKEHLILALCHSGCGCRSLSDNGLIIIAQPYVVAPVCMHGPRRMS
jgi:hypothetical protein